MTGIVPQESFMPHGVCLLWNQWLLWLSAASDILIAIAYFSIPMALLTFARRRKDFEYGRLLVLFALFIMLCGTTHLLGAIILWKPLYYLDIAAKIATAIISVYTAFVIWPLIPTLLSVPSPLQFEHANKVLREAVEQAKKFSNAMDEVPSYIYIKDLNSRYIYANKATLKLLNAPPRNLWATVTRIFSRRKPRQTSRPSTSRCFNAANQ